uniref:Amino acid transporter n=1 Tax=Arion vulgaris TaxID=1028688 RepID=A0A0B7A5S1_9EUPU
MSIYKQSTPSSKYKKDTTNITGHTDQMIKLFQTDNVKDEQHEIAADGVQTWKKVSKRKQKCVRWFKDNLFLLLTFVGIIAGLLIGLTVRTAHPGPDAVVWIGMPGELYMRMLQAMILPLVICTVIDGTANTDPKSNGRITLVTMTYIIITNALGGIIGIALCYIISPGSTRADDEWEPPPDTRNLQTLDIFADFIRNIFPDNIVAATMQMSQTKYSVKEIALNNNDSDHHATNVTSFHLVKSVTSVSGTNILGLIVISAAVGIAASQAKDKVQPFIDFFNAGARIIFLLFSWVKWTTPVGVASLIARALVTVDNIESAFSSMGLFMLTTSGGCLLYQCTILPIILVIMTRRNPFKFLTHVVKPWMLAFGPATSTIPLPEMIRVSEEEYRVDPRVAGFTIPFCVTLNRDGSCLFISATCLFVAQYTRTSLDTGQIFTLGILSIMSSLAIPAVPSSSVVAVLVILGSLGLSTHSIGLIMAVEWLNDRIRTTTNIVSHMVATLVTWRLCRDSLEKTSRTDHINDNIKDIEIL